MYKIFLKTTAFLSLILVGGCSEHRGKMDDQLNRFLDNDNVELRIALSVDISADLSQITSEAWDWKDKKTYQYPGIISLDDRFIFLKSQGGVLTPIITTPASPFEGPHILKIMFSDDMLYKEEQLTSKNKDSVELTFTADLFKVDDVITVNGDSIVLTVDKDIPGYKADFSPMAVSDSGVPIADKEQRRIETDIKNGRIAIPVNQFQKEGYKNYYFTVWFIKELPLMYKGKKKGNFSYNCMMKGIRFKLK